MMLSRTGWALAGVSVLSAGLLAPDAGRLVAATTGPDFPQALLAMGSLLQLAISVWVLLAIALAPLRGTSHLARLVTPQVLRRFLFAGAVGALALSPAQAERGSSPAHTVVQSLDGLRLPDRPIGSAPTTITTIEVQPGDTLWAIAARSLPAHATDAEIARACNQWYAANRDVIGDDADLILPKQQLTPPAKDATS